MAIGNPTLVGSATAATASTTIAATGCVIPANSLVVVVVFNRATADPGDPTSVKDNAGTPNSYTNQVSSGANGDNGRVSIWWFYDSAGATRTITATFGSSSTRGIYVYTVASAASVTPNDQTGSGVGFSRSLVVTTTGNIAQADEDSIVAYFIGGTTVVSGFPFTNYTSLVNTTVNSRQFLVEYRNQLTAGATESAGGATDVASNTNLGRVIFTFKGAGGGTKSVAPAAINATSAMAGAVVKLAAVKPAAFTATSTVAASVVKLAAVRPAAVTATSALSGTVSRSKPVTPGALAATSTVAGSLQALRKVSASFNATSALAGAVTISRTVTPAAISSTSTVTGTVTLFTPSRFLLYNLTGTDRVRNIERWLIENYAASGFTLTADRGLDRVQNIEAWLHGNSVKGHSFVSFDVAGTDRMWAIESFLVAATA